MGLINVTNITDGTTADAADVNSQVNTIVSEFNGNIENANIKSGAAIATSKLATDAGISTGMIADGAVTYAKVPDGFQIGFANQGLNSTGTTSAAIPLDDTIPQNTEGTELVTVSITPKSSTSLLEVTAHVLYSQGASVTSVQAAIFRDSTADAITAGWMQISTGAGPSGVLRLQCVVTAASTSATTFKLRFGSAGGTSRWNGSGGRYFGDIPKTGITVREIKAS